MGLCLQNGHGHAHKQNALKPWNEWDGAVGWRWKLSPVQWKLFTFSVGTYFIWVEKERFTGKKRTSFVVMCFAAVYFILLCSHACVRVCVYPVECSSNQKHMETWNELHLANPKFPSHCLLWDEMAVYKKINFCRKIVSQRWISKWKQVN